MGRGAEVVRAKPDDAQTLTRISFAAKRHWGYPERWLEGWKDALAITPEFIRDNEVCMAMSGGDPVGFYALVGSGDMLELEHLWIGPDHIDEGFGRTLFEHAVARAASMGASRLNIEADPNAEGFYLRMGARRTGENVYEIEGERRELPTLVLDVLKNS